MSFLQVVLLCVSSMHEQIFRKCFEGRQDHYKYLPTEEKNHHHQLKDINVF